MPKVNITKALNKIPMPKARSGPVWKGPEEDGITFSLLSRFLCCRERFRLLVVEGLKPAEHFNPRIEFGQMWHVCEEELAKTGGEVGPANDDWCRALVEYCKGLCKKFPLEQEKIDHWYKLAKAMFPMYVDYWSKHPDVKDRSPLLQEQVFEVPYHLPSGRTVKLRGKFDSVDLVGKGKEAGIWLQENKTKSSIDTDRLSRQLRFDLQTMIYLVAYYELAKRPDRPKVLTNLDSKLRPQGVRYNVIRRPAHKSVDNAMKKLNEDLGTGRIGEWLARWKVDVSTEDVLKFRREHLDPVLEQLCDWWGWIKYCLQENHDPFTPVDVGGEEGRLYGLGLHWRHPFGVYNVLDEGGASDLDLYLEDGNETGLQRVEQLFGELKP